MSTTREAFEAWLAKEMHDAGLPLVTAKRRAADISGREWRAYQAATERAAKLVEGVREAYANDDSAIMAHVVAAGRCAAAIRAEGEKT